MDIKYKYAEFEDWFYYFNRLGEKSQAFTKDNRPGMYQDMMEWVAKGNTIEPAETEDEKKVKEDKEKEKALESQNKICKNLLDQTQYIVDGDCDYPQADIDNCKVWRGQIKAIMRGSVIVKIPERTF